ncbi:MAG: hypothetical protein CMH30_06765 [Micavibrio sp.]|nr:hypothetical protein [Micavibrio sp.]
MGRLVSAPKIPTSRLSSYATADSTALSPTLTAADSPSAAVSVSEEQTATEERNLLERSRRGIGSTIRTSLRGLLDNNNQSPARKSLLGE